MNPDESAGVDFEGVGRAIAAHRRLRGLAAVDLAAAVDRSASWLYQVESGVQHVDRLSTLINIARVLKVRLDDLIDRSVDVLTPGGTREFPGAHEIRAALTTVTIRSFSDDAPALTDIKIRVDAAWEIWNTSPHFYSDLALIVPTLVRDAEHARRVVGESQQRDVWRVLAEVYGVARMWLRKIGEEDLALISADRMINAAQQVDDELLLATAGWNLATVLQRRGDSEQALAVAMDSTGLLRDEGVDHRSIRGQLHLNAAISAARLGRDGEAWRLWREADAIARSLGVSFCEPRTTFGTLNVGMHDMSLRLEMGKPNEAIERAEHMDINAMPSVERKARHLLDTARGYISQRDDGAGVLILLEAEQTSSEEVRYSTLSRELVREMVLRDKGTSRRQVRALARRIGLLDAV